MVMTRAGERRDQCECGHAEQTPFHTLSSTKQGDVTELCEPLCMAIFGGLTSGKSLIFLVYPDMIVRDFLHDIVFMFQNISINFFYFPQLCRQVLVARMFVHDSE